MTMSPILAILLAATSLAPAGALAASSSSSTAARPPQPALRASGSEERRQAVSEMAAQVEQKEAKRRRLGGAEEVEQKEAKPENLNGPPPIPENPTDWVEAVDVCLSFMDGASTPPVRVTEFTPAANQHIYNLATVDKLRRTMAELDVFHILGDLPKNRRELEAQAPSLGRGTGSSLGKTIEAMGPGVEFYNDPEKVQFFVDGEEERLGKGVNLLKLAEEGVVEESPFTTYSCAGGAARQPEATPEFLAGLRQAAAARRESGEVPSVTLRVLFAQKSVAEHLHENFPFEV